MCTTEPAPEASTVNISALAEEIDEELDEEFAQLFSNETWNLQPGNDSSVTDVSGVQTDTDNDVNNDDNSIDGAASNAKWGDWLDDGEDAQQTTTLADDVTADSNVMSTENTPTHDNNNKPLQGHNGVWGPNDVKDIDYDDSATPFIVLGVIATIVFVLMVLIFVAKKLSLDNERLKYRPLNESFPSSTPYHDSKHGSQYHDVE